MKLIYHDNEFQVLPEGVEMPKEPKHEDFYLPNGNWRPHNHENNAWQEALKQFEDARETFHSQFIPICEKDQEKVKNICANKEYYFSGDKALAKWQPIPDHVYEVDVKMKLFVDCVNNSCDGKCGSCPYMEKQYRLIEQEKKYPKLSEEQIAERQKASDEWRGKENPAHSFTEGSEQEKLLDIASTISNSALYQLCPKCNGDGNLMRFNPPAFLSTSIALYDRIASLEAELKKSDLALNNANHCIGVLKGELNEARKEIERLKVKENR